MAKIASKSAEKEKIKEKDKYRVTNWSSYNNSLKKRGDITLWKEETIVESWYHDGPNQQDSQYTYSVICIETLLQLKRVIKLAYRQLEGFSNSIIKLMGFDISMPSCTQICRRSKEIEVDLEVTPSKTPLYIVDDSTGLKE